MYGPKDGILSQLNFHILPIANPDGYEFTRPPMDENVENVSNVYAEKMFYTMVYLYGTYNTRLYNIFDKIISIYRIDCGEKIVYPMVVK